MDRPPVLGVSEIVLSVADLPAMREFYESVLGFEVYAEACHETDGDPEPEGEPTISFLKVADVATPLGQHGHPQLLVLIDHQRHVFAKNRFDGHDIKRSTLNHLAFEIPPASFDDHFQRLSGLRLKPTISHFPSFSAKAMFFHDPEGNVLEFIAHSHQHTSDETED